MILNRSKPRQPGHCRKLFAATVFLCACLTAFAQTTNAPNNSTDVKTFYCVDAGKLDFAKRLLLDSLQAIANSNAPVLFAGDDENSWRIAMEKQLGENSGTISFDDALARFGAGVPQVIYDSQKPWSLSMATTLAGVHRALLTDRPLEGHAVAFDCRNRWANKLEAYRWAVAELLPKCDHHQLVYLNESVTTLRDYAIQQKLFVLNLNPLNNAQEVKLLNEILAMFPPQTRVFGWAKGGFADHSKGQDGGTIERALVSLLSQHGMMLVPADFAANLSFYDQTGGMIPKLAQLRPQRDMKFERGKRYVLLVVSDGDNLQYDLRALRKHWLENNRPKVPLAWTISPQLTEVGPAVLRTYYQEAAARGGLDEFIAGPSGYGYINPGNMNLTQVYDFVRLTAAACEQADLRSIALLDDGSRPAAPVLNYLRAYATQKFDGLWLVAMPMFVGISGETAYLNERFRLGRDNAAEIARRVKETKTANPFIMVYVDGWTGTGKPLSEFVEQLDDTCVLVSPTEMARLIRQSNAASARPASAYSSVRQLNSLPGDAEGLTPVPAEDGKFTVTEQNGTACWLLPKNYFYWDVDDGFNFPANATLEIELEYFDAGSGEIGLEYDSTDVRTPVGGAYKEYPITLRRANTKQWRLARFQLNDARFRGAQNNEADFRFYNGGDDLMIRAVRVRRMGN